MTATADTAFPGSFNSDATFRSWGSKVSALLTAAGWTKTADTGQIDFSTVTQPASGSYGGYEIRKLDDSLNGSAPIIMKVEYGQGGTTSTPILRFNFGTASNGSGTLSGRGLATSNVTIGQSVTDGTSVNAFACGVDGLANFCHPGAGATTMYGFCIERFRDDNGDPTAEGYQATFIMGATTNPTISEYTVSFTQNVSRASRAYLPCLFAITTAVEGSSTGAFPAQVIHGLQKPPGIGYVGVFFTDLGAGVTMTISRYGTTRTYKQMCAAGYSTIGPGSETGRAVAFLYE